jgi:hypothetical protein
VNTQRVKHKIRDLQARSKQLLARVWSLSRTTQTVQQKDPDGWIVKHNYMDEEAVYNLPVESDLVKTLEGLRSLILLEFPSVSFNSKISRLWIQTYIDQHLYGEFGNLVMQRQSNRSFFGERFSQYGAHVKHLTRMLDILFHFEQVKHGSDTVQSTFFQKDVRGWIVHLATCLIFAGGFDNHRHLLLHVLRTPGIGQWAPALVQFPTLNVYSQPYFDHYLVSLGAFLGPVKELEEQLQTHDLQKSVMRTSLKTLADEGEWIVVPEIVFSFVPRSTTNV